MNTDSFLNPCPVLIRTTFLFLLFLDKITGMVENTDYYTFLQIAPSATLDEVRAAYKRLALIYHPDRSDHPQATRQMQLLTRVMSC